MAKKKLRKYIGRVSNGRDLYTAGKIGAAGGIAYVVNDLLGKAADKIRDYSPGRIIRNVVTKTEKGVYNLDRAVEDEVKKLPGGKKVLDTNKGIVSYFWDNTIGRGGADKQRTQDFYRRTKIPQHYAIERTTRTETRVPPMYNIDAANNKTLLGSACTAVNVLLGVYALKEGAKYFIRKVRGKK